MAVARDTIEVVAAVLGGEQVQGLTAQLLRLHVAAQQAGRQAASAALAATTPLLAGAQTMSERVNAALADMGVPPETVERIRGPLTEALNVGADVQRVQDLLEGVGIDSKLGARLAEPLRQLPIEAQAAMERVRSILGGIGVPEDVLARLGPELQEAFRTADPTEAITERLRQLQVPPEVLSQIPQALQRAFAALGPVAGIAAELRQILPPDLAQAFEAQMQRMISSLQQMALGLRPITGKEIPQMVSQIGAWIDTGGILQGVNDRVVGSLDRLQRALIGANSVMADGNRELRNVAQQTAATEREQLQLEKRGRGMEHMWAGMENRSRGASLALNLVGSAAAGLLPAFSLMQGSIIGVLFGLLFIKFSMPAVTLAVFSLTTAFLALTKAMSFSIAQFREAQDTLFVFTQQLGSFQAGLGAFTLGERIARDFGVPISQSLGLVSELIKAAPPLINQVTKATLDLAAATGKDLTEASRIVTQAIGRERGNLLALAEAGIRVDEATAEIVDEQDRLARTTFITDRILERFSGAMQERTKTLSAQFSRTTENAKALFRAMGAPIVQQVLVPLLRRLADLLSSLVDLTKSFLRSAEFAKLWGRLMDEGRKLMRALGLDTEKSADKVRNLWIRALVLSIQAMTLFLIVTRKVVEIFRQIGAAIRFTLPFWKALIDIIRRIIGWIKALLDWIRNLKDGVFSLGDLVRATLAAIVGRLGAVLARDFGAALQRGLREGSRSASRGLPLIVRELGRDFRRVLARELTPAAFFVSLRRALATQFRLLVSGLRRLVPLGLRELIRDIRRVLRGDLGLAGFFRNVFRLAMNEIGRGIRGLGGILARIPGQLGRLIERFVTSPRLRLIDPFDEIARFIQRGATRLIGTLLSLPGLLLRIPTLLVRLPIKLLTDRESVMAVFKDLTANIRTTAERALGRDLAGRLGRLGLELGRALRGGLVFAVADIASQFGISLLPVGETIKRFLSKIVQEALLGAFIGAGFGLPGVVIGGLFGAITGALEALFGVDLLEFLIRKVQELFTGSWKAGIQLSIPVIAGALAAGLTAALASGATIVGIPAAPLVGVAVFIASLFSVALAEKFKTEIRRALGVAWAAALDFLRGGFQSLLGALAPALDPIIGFLEPLLRLLEPLIGAFRRFGQTVVEGLAPVGDVIRRLIEPFAFLGEQLPPVFDELAATIQFWADRVRILLAPVSLALRILLLQFQLFASSVETGLRLVAALFEFAFRRIRATVELAIETLLIVLRPFFNLLAGLAAFGLTSLVDAFRLIFGLVQIIVSTALQIVTVLVRERVRAIIEFWRENWREVVSVLEGVWRLVAAIIQIGLAVITGFIRVALALLRGDWEAAWRALRETFAQIWQGITRAISAGLQILTGMFRLAWAAIQLEARVAWRSLRTVAVALFSGMRQALVLLVRSLATQVVRTFSTIPRLLLGLVRDFGRAARLLGEAWLRAFLSLLRDLRRLGSQLWDALVGGIVDRTRLAASFARDIGLSLLGELQAALDPGRFLQIGSAVVQGLLAGIQEATGALASWLQGLGDLAVSAVGNLGGLLRDAGRTLLTGLLVGVIELWERRIRIWLDIAEKVQMAVGNLGSVLLQKGRDLIRGLWDGIRQIWELSVRPWLDIRSKVLTAVGSLLAVLFERGRDLILGFLNGLRGFWDSDLAPWLRGLPGQILSAIGTLGELLASRGRQLILGFRVAIITEWVRLRTYLSERPEKIKNAIGGLGFLLYQVGRDLIQGLWNGIRDKWDELVDWITEKVDKLPGPVKKLLGIDSPSRVFASIGEEIVQGLLQGLGRVWPLISRFFASAGRDLSQIDLGSLESVVRTVRETLVGAFASHQFVPLGEQIARGIALGISRSTNLISGALGLALPEFRGLQTQQGLVIIQAQVHVSDSVVTTEAAMEELAGKISDHMGGRFSRQSIRGGLLR